MTDLERDLRDLGRGLDWPETPDLAAAVAPRLDPGPPSRRGWPRRRIALALALALLVPAGVVMAVPASREAVLDWLGLRSVEVRRVQALPPLPGQSLDLAPRVSLATARLEAGFPLAVPSALGEPDTVHLSRGDGRIEVTLVYGPRPGLPAAPESGVGLLISQLRGTTEPELLRKLVSTGTAVRRLRVGGDPAISLEGDPHVVVFLDPRGDVRTERLRLAGNALLVERDGVLVRLEAALPAGDLVRIAESLR